MMINGQAGHPDPVFCHEEQQDQVQLLLLLQLKQ
jgi:hypothetical protein